jgi:hypothetical protein
MCLQRRRNCHNLIRALIIYVQYLGDCELSFG